MTPTPAQQEVLYALEHGAYLECTLSDGKERYALVQGETRTPVKQKTGTTMEDVLSFLGKDFVSEEHVRTRRKVIRLWGPKEECLRKRESPSTLIDVDD